MRSISQIYSEAVATRNNYLQLTELNTGRSNSKLSIINLLTYVVAVCIHTYETILDVFQVKIAETLSGRINGTPNWYAIMAKKFQYNSVTQSGDPLMFNEDTMKVEYETIDVSKRIIERVAWQTDESNNSLVLKVCKANENSDEVDNGMPYMPLSNNELTAFKMFIKEIKFIGASIYCESCPGDILTIIADADSPIYYDDNYVTSSQAFSLIKQSLIDYVNGLEFNGMIYYQSILDVIRKTEHVSEIGPHIRVMINQYNPVEQRYESAKELTTRMTLKSGYIRLLDEDSAITINEDNITLVPVSQI